MHIRQDDYEEIDYHTDVCVPLTTADLLSKLIHVHLNFIQIIEELGHPSVRFENVGRCDQRQHHVT